MGGFAPIIVVEALSPVVGGFAPIIVVEALSPVCWIHFPRFDISRNLWTEC